MTLIVPKNTRRGEEIADSWAKWLSEEEFVAALQHGAEDEGRNLVYRRALLREAASRIGGQRA